MDSPFFFFFVGAKNVLFCSESLCWLYSSYCSQTPTFGVWFETFCSVCDADDNGVGVCLLLSLSGDTLTERETK